MADEEKPKSWWHTLPGVITSVAAAITAVAGLVAAVKQTGWFDQRMGKAAVTSDATVNTPPTLGGAAKADSKPVVVEPAGAALSSDGTAQSVTLPVVRSHSLQRLDGSNKATFSVLKIEIVPRNAETKLLKLRVRVLNEDRYPMNFWGESFRLVVDGAPRQPDQAPNEVLESNAAKDADLIFAIPRDAQNIKLRLLHAEEVTDIALLPVTAR
jgi:hypothetical protein